MKKLLAPNGKPSNLNDKQYKIVRTPAFKKWFGDWEILAEAKTLSNNIKGVYKLVALNDIERFLFEISQQANSSKSEKKGSIDAVGEKIVELALKLFPNSKVEDEYIPVVSKVVDDNNEPLIVWHGTKKEFTVFGKDKTKGIDIEFEKEYLYRKNTNYFHIHKKYAKTFGSKYGGFEKLYFLNIKKLKLIDKETIEDIGYWKYIYDDYVNLGFDGVYSEDGQYVTLLNPNQIKLADGSNTTFDSNNDDIRYAGGGELYIEDFKKMSYDELMLHIKDSYKDLGAEIGIKGHTKDGEPIIGYLPYQNEYMYKSDSTGKNIRFYIDLGNEKYIHPSEINPKFNISEQKRIEQKADYFAKISNEEYNKIISELEKNNELNLVVDTLNKALKTFNIENQYDSSDIFKSYGNSILESKDGNKRRMKFDVYYFRVNDSELKTNVKNLDLERFNNEYLKKDKFKNGGTIDDKYQKIVDEIKKAIIDLGLPYLNEVDEFNRYYLSKSKNDFGQSWYMIFLQENRPLEIRISDHSVTSSSRIMDDKYIAMLDVYNPFKYKTAIGIVKSLDLEFKRLKDIREKRNKLFNEEREKRNYMNNKLQSFLDKLKSENKSIGKNDRTYQTLEEIITKHPDWEYVYHYPNDGAFSFYFVKNDKSGSLSPHFINEQYFNFLNDNGYLDKFKSGGRTIAQTPAPKKERIYGSNINKEKSSESNTSAKQIMFDEKTIKSIKNKVDKHNEENPDKLITLSSAKAVVRRGMGAYSSSHRPTIKGGKPNSRVAWGLARLNAFIYKVKNGVSKSGKYTQDDDLIKELNIKYNTGGEISKESINNVKNDKKNYLNILNNIWSVFGIKLD